MPIRGDYTPEEEKMLADWRERVGRGGVWVGEKPSPEYIWPVFHRVATKDLILNMAIGIGDVNPLWRDENYARNTRWGGIIAPPLFPSAICTLAREVAHLEVPANAGSMRNFSCGPTWEFHRHISVGDSFRVRDNTSFSIEDVTSLDGTGPRLFIVSAGREYINQNDEIVCVVYNKRGISITPNNKKDDAQPVPPSKKPTDYRYTKEELEYIDRIYDEEEIRGANPRYWEDVNIGDGIKPIVAGPFTVWDQILEYAGRGIFVSNSREIRKTRLMSVNVDTVTGIIHPHPEIHLVDRIAKLAGQKQANISRDWTEEILCRLITNWMGDDGFLKRFDMQGYAMVPIGDTLICRGEVTKKWVDNGEYLVNIRIWAETIRGYVSHSAMATVSLFSKIKNL